MDQMNVHKVTLGSGKVVLLRDMKLQYEDLALQAAGTSHGKNEALQAKRFQDELLKILIVEVDGKKLSHTELEKLDKVFSYKDIVQLRKVMTQLVGDEGDADPKLEVVTSSGDK